MPTCTMCAIFFGGSAIGDGVCQSCHAAMHTRAFGNRPRPTVPMARARPVPITVTASVTVAGVDPAIGRDHTGMAIIKGSKVEIIAEGKKIGEGTLIKHEFRRKTRYDIISRGNDELGVNSDEDPDVEGP